MDVEVKKYYMPNYGEVHPKSGQYVLIKILDVEKVKKKYIHRCGEEDAGTVASGSASSQAQAQTLQPPAPPTGGRR
jgi:hypothetical protein